MTTAAVGNVGAERTGASAISLQEKVQALQRSAIQASQPIEAIETHFAWLFFTDTRVYKLKKPVRNEYVDLTSVRGRELICAEELRLNRRLAPDVYLSVSPLARAADGTLRVDGDGSVVDWLVVMRRLPAALMLDRAITAGSASAAMLASVGRTLERFYASQQRIDFDPAAFVERIAGQIQADRRALHAPELGLSAELVQTTTAKVWSAFARVDPELAVRARERRIVEAHGDLRPEHVCLTDPPRIIDALEFSRDLRTLDPGEELAFLGLECARLQGEQAWKTILQSYLQQSADPISARLLQFYRSRRAMVRAKLVAWHLCDPQYRYLAPWRDQAHTYLELAAGSAEQAAS